MTRQYLQPIQMTLRAGRPARFTWRGENHVVAETLGSWRLRDRWWELAALGQNLRAGASDRVYYRLRCVDGLICEVYHDAARDIWILDKVYD